VRGSKCLAILPRKDQLRIAFYLGEAEGNHPMTASAGAELLGLQESGGREETARVIAGTMAALLSGNQPGAALEVWHRHRAKIVPAVYPMVLRLTVAQAVRLASGRSGVTPAMQNPGVK
jgi:hypothetical protein